MAKNPADRYQTTAEMLAALVAVLKAEGQEAPPDPTGEQAALDLPPEEEPPVPPEPEPRAPPGTSTEIPALQRPRQRPQPSRRAILYALPVVAAGAAVGGYATVKALKGREPHEEAKDNPNPAEPPKPKQPQQQPQPPAQAAAEQKINVPTAVMGVAVSSSGQHLAVAMTDYNKRGGVI